MSVNLQNLRVNLSHYRFGEPDAVTSHLPLLGSPIPVWTITLSYLYFVLKWGPAFMKNRSAYNVKYALLLYNLIQIILNFFICIYSVLKIFYYRSTIPDFGCCEPLPSDHTLKSLELITSYVYYIIKISDYFDTVFFVLRKSFKQITFLHVYHHVLMVLFNYYYLRFHGTGGQFISAGILNTAVHGFMYTYYFVAALRPNVKNSIWWKKYITRLQILQFALVLLHNLYPLIYRPDCRFPRILLYFGASQAILMMILFGNFYWKTYIKKKQPCFEEILKKE